MPSSLTIKEGFVVAGLALLCTAAGVAMLTENPGAGAVSMADAVDLLRRWSGS